MNSLPFKVSIVLVLLFSSFSCSVRPRFANGGNFCMSSVTEPSGGRDFNGAVRVVVTVSLRPSDSGREVLADVTARFERNSLMIPQVTSSWESLVVQTLSPETEGRITAIEPRTGRAEGITSGAGPEFGVCNDGEVFRGPGVLEVSGVIEQIEVIGDTGSLDISNDENCDCDSQIKSITLRRLELTIE